MAERAGQHFRLVGNWLELFGVETMRNQHQPLETGAPTAQDQAEEAFDFYRSMGVNDPSYYTCISADMTRRLFEEGIITSQHFLEAEELDDAVILSGVELAGEQRTLYVFDQTPSGDDLVVYDY